MKSTLLRKLLCALAISLMPFLAFAGGTNTQSDPSTGYEKAPDKSTQQGDMGTGVGTEDSASPQERVSDSELTKQVEKALKNEAQLKNLDIDVEVNNGVATLSGDAKAMLDGDGAALVVHAAADDYHTDPSGNSGARIACGVFR